MIPPNSLCFALEITSTILDIAMANHAEQFNEMWQNMTNDQQELITTEMAEQTKAAQQVVHASRQAADKQALVIEDLEQKVKALETNELTIQADWEQKMLQKEKENGILAQQVLAAQMQVPLVAAGAAATKKQNIKQPEMYKSDRDIKNYVRVWNNYKRICQMNDKECIQSFYTFLDEDTQQKIGELSERENLSWVKFKELVQKTLEKPLSRSAMRHQLRFLKQGRDESLLDYKDKLEKIANQAFTEDRSAEKDVALKDALCSGLRDDTVAIEIIGKEDWTFKNALDFALQKENSITARKQMNHNGEQQEVAILQVKEDSATRVNRVEERPRQAQGNNTGNENAYKRCFNCNLPGHFAATCNSKPVCYFCEQPGHIKKACFKYLNQKRNSEVGMKGRHQGPRNQGYQSQYGQNQGMPQGRSGYFAQNGRGFPTHKSRQGAGPARQNYNAQNQFIPDRSYQTGNRVRKVQSKVSKN